MLQVVDFTDRINFYVMDAVSFFRNPSPNLRGNASLLVGALVVPYNTLGGVGGSGGSGGEWGGGVDGGWGLDVVCTCMRCLYVCVCVHTHVTCVLYECILHCMLYNYLLQLGLCMCHVLSSNLCLSNHCISGFALGHLPEERISIISKEHICDGGKHSTFAHCTITH